VVSAFNSLGDTDLVFPLSGSDFSVDSGDLKSGGEEGSEGGFDHASSEGVGGSDTAVVSSLGFGETIGGETEGPLRSSSFLGGHEEFLLDSEPGVVFGGFIHNLVAEGSEVISGRGDFIRCESFTENQNSIAILS
jgi:hypothetical protein